MRVVDMGDKELRMLLDEARSMGRGGDTELVHINKAEEKMLKESGGAGTKNPKTGLKEYYQAPGGAKAAAGTEHGKKTDAGARSGGARGEGSGGVRGAGGYSSPTGRLQDRADVKAMTGGKGISGEEADRISKEWANRVSGLAGTNIDPVEIGLSLLGAVNPIAGLLGLGYRGLKMGGVINGPSVNIGGGYKSVADLVGAGASAGVNTASGSQGGPARRDSDPGKRRMQGQNNSSPSRAFRNANSKPKTPPKTTPAPAVPKTPAEVLLEKHQLPGINVPFSLTPYTIDRTRHQQIVGDLLASRGMPQGG